MRRFLQSGLGIGLVAGVLVILLIYTPLANINLLLLLLAVGFAGHLAGNRGQGMARAAREGSLAGGVSGLLGEGWGLVSGAQAALKAPLLSLVEMDLATVLAFAVIGAALGAVGGFVGGYAARQRGL